jgi:alkylation response protein AidB-like acyl-CoA dehydrogenase
MARKFFEQRVTPFHAQWEKDGQISRECWREAGQQGLLCMTMPEKYGGAGQDILSAAIVWEEQSYAYASGVGWSLHSEIVAPYLLHWGTEEQRQRFLPRMVRLVALLSLI